MTEELFNRYLEGSCNDQEMKAVEKWLYTAEPTELDRIFSRIWDEVYESMPDAQRIILWNNLRAGVGGASDQHSGDVLPMVRKDRGATAVLWKKWIGVAAALLVVLVTGWTGLHRMRGPVERVARITGDTTRIQGIRWTVLANDERKEKKILLEDGSEVLLGSHSSFKYAGSFIKDARDLYLEGSALFKVARDEHQPFTVYGGGLATTVLGTIFRVHADSSSHFTRIWLYQGKVVVRSLTPGPGSWKDVFLSPGDEIVYDNRKSKAVVNRFDDGRPYGAAEKETTPENKGMLTFSNASLVDVFDRLMAHYHQKITYKRKELVYMDFTGSIMDTDSLSVILEAISHMNRLTVTRNEEGFTVGRSGK
jgi:transmembrane sensor